MLDRTSNGILLTYSTVNLQAFVDLPTELSSPYWKSFSLIELKQAAFPFQRLRKRNPRREERKLLALGRLMAGGGWPAGDDEAVRRSDGRDGG